MSTEPTGEDTWAALRFLMGEWVAEGDPSQGKGGFSLTPDLQGKILVRKNHAEYEATAERPAIVHDDLMIIYPEATGSHLRASYFDNEGHVIHYAVLPLEDGKAVEFLSDASPVHPSYRLTYVEQRVGRVLLRFEIAPPGVPPTFSTYIESTVRRES